MAFQDVELNAQDAGEVRLIEALRLGGEVRLTLSSPNQRPEAYTVHGMETPQRMRFGQATTLIGAAPKGVVRVSWPGGTVLAVPADPNLDFFAGHTVGLAIRSEERPEIARDWLDWHRTHHGMSAALIVDRAARPGFSDGLRALVAQTEFPVMVVRPGVALGRAELGREGDPYFAPDAPGRDRMVPPEPDAWLAPLADVAIYEAMRHRFLANARGVMNLDLCDLLAPQPDRARDVFDLACRVPGGVVALGGRHVYPWRLPRGRPVEFADHTCAMFDRPSLRRRWCLAPDMAGPTTHWRLLRVAGANPDPAKALGFWRAMALKHPDARVAALVPKAGLKEDPALIAATDGRQSIKPVRMPKAKLRRPKSKGTVTLVTSMKNEGPFILDWIAWHRAIGADRFLIYSNDCTDGTEEMLALLDAEGLIEHRNNDGYRATGLTPQHSVLAAADQDAVTRKADWLAFVDCDEFINIKRGEGRFSDLFAAVPDANMISMTWRLFGNGDVHGFEDVPVFDQFTQCAPELCRKPHQAWGFKTLFRNEGIYRKLGVHRPKGLSPQLVDHINWVNGSGAAMPKSIFRNGWRSTTATYGYDIVQLNHYAVRSAESFLVKRERGRANHITRDQGLGYWFRMNNNAVQGDIHAPARALFEAEKARLLENPKIRAAHAVAVSRHIDRIAILKDDPFYAEFYDVLTSERMERLSRLLGHFGAGVFQSGPGVVPDERVFGEWKEDDFFTVPLPETDARGFGD
ncbi:MAG: glycosyltransferase family 2 protein [Pseudomonadota bacterium]